MRSAIMIPRPKRGNVNFDNNYIQQEENKNIEGIPEQIYPETTLSKPKTKKLGYAERAKHVWKKL